mmetsp:Transcript_12533/g.26761  ORF Transcript_12533/g.26761 Transcript_12533/m.26761 type:complete len:801 (-) Transcript_12533:8-2410(-)
MRMGRLIFNLLVGLVLLTLVVHTWFSLTHHASHAVGTVARKSSSRSSMRRGTGVMWPGMQLFVDEADPGISEDDIDSQHDAELTEASTSTLPGPTPRARVAETRIAGTDIANRTALSPAMSKTTASPPSPLSRQDLIERAKNVKAPRASASLNALLSRLDSVAPPPPPPPPVFKPVDCLDLGPWPCHESGCPSTSVGCKDMESQCSWTFGRLFQKPPSEHLRTKLVSALCPKTCGVCSVAEEEAEAEKALRECKSGGGKKNACEGGRGVWGAIWKEAPPEGENLNYHAPTTIEKYMELTDGSSWQEKSKADSHGCTRYFKVGDRGDMRQTVKPMLKELGICEAKDDSHADFMWTRPWEVIAAFFRAKVIQPGAIVNSLGGLPQQIGQKMSLARLHVGCMKRNGYDPLDAIPKSAPFCRFTSRAFAVRREADRLQVAYKRFQQYTQQLDADRPEKHRIWILKPQGGFNQIGIHMYSMSKEASSTEEGVLQWMTQRVPEGTWVLQEYIMNPMTYKGHKFDLRIWAVVTSLDPLRMHLLKTGIPKVSQWKFSKDVVDTKEQCIHVLMPGTLECFTDARADVLRPYPTRTDVPEWWAAMDPVGEKFWKNVAWPSIEFKLVELMLLARDPILHIDHSIKRKGIQYKRIFFLQPDIVLDNNGDAYMVEVNTNGYMIGNLHKDFFPLFEEQRGLMRTVGANGFPQAHKYMKQLKAQTQKFCEKSECTPALEREIWELVHEDMHANQGWYRIFPTREDRPHTRLLKQAPQYAKSLTILDRLSFAWLERKWSPKHTHDQNASVVVLDQK